MLEKVVKIALTCALGCVLVPSVAYAEDLNEEDGTRETAAEIALLNAPSIAAEDSVVSFSAALRASDGSEVSVVAKEIAGKEYLFLPSYADSSSLKLIFETQTSDAQLLLSTSEGSTFEQFNSGDLLDLSLCTQTGGAWTIQYKFSESGEANTLRVMQSVNIRSMYLISEDPINQGRAYIDGSEDHSTKTTGTMLLVDPNGSVAYNGKLTQIKGRGNSTWGCSDKKPYQIKLDKKTDLLETGDKANKNKTWVLLANASDPTLLKNRIASALGLALGGQYTPECAPVDLYYDGEYRGSYLLSEKVQINSGRVDIANQEDAMEAANPGVDLDYLPTLTSKNSYGYDFQFVSGIANPADISGGYLLEIDSVYYRGERSWFRTSQGTVVIKEPENCSLEQVKYVSEKFQAMLNACASDDVTAAGGLSRYADIDSIAREFLINDFAKNPDFCGSSTFFYLPASTDSQGNIFYGGPIWDFDTAFGVRTEITSGPLSDTRSTNGVYFSSTWFDQNSEAIGVQARIMQEEMVPILKAFVGNGSSSIQSFDSMVKEISASEAMNEVLWGFSTFNNSAEPYDTYEENVDYLRTWIQNRTAWVEANFKVAEADEGVDMYRLYNPYSGEHFYTSSTEERDTVVKSGWNYEGVGWKAPTVTALLKPVYRLYSGTDHHYTMDKGERDNLISLGWKDEGIGWYSASESGVPLYRQFNPYVQPNAKTNNSGSHNYTTSVSESNNLVMQGWRYEGIAWYGLAS